MINMEGFLTGSELLFLVSHESPTHLRETSFTTAIARACFTWNRMVEGEAPYDHGRPRIKRCPEVMLSVKMLVIAAFNHFNVGVCEFRVS